MSGHFRKEEEVLLPVLARYVQYVLGRRPVVKMLAKHARIRGLVMQLSGEYAGRDVRSETLGERGELLEAYIRLEERAAHSYGSLGLHRVVSLLRFSTAQICATLYISKYTVQEHLCSAFDKVGVRDRQALVKRLVFDNVYPTLLGNSNESLRELSERPIPGLKIGG
jgi:hypothetical protein